MPRLAGPSYRTARAPPFCPALRMPCHCAARIFSFTRLKCQGQGKLKLRESSPTFKQITLWCLLFFCILHTCYGGQRYRITLEKDPRLGLGLRLVKLKSRVVILDIVPGSPGINLLSIGDVIAAVNKVPVPPNSLVGTVQSMIIQAGDRVELVIDKDWGRTTRYSAASGKSAQTQTTARSSTSSKQSSNKFPLRTKWRYQISLARKPTTGFGLRLRKPTDTPFIIIDGVVAGSVAASLNMIKPNDQIESIDSRYLVHATLDDVITYLRKHMKVHMTIVASGSSGPVREHYLDMKFVLPKRHKFLGLQLRYSNHNKSIFVEKIFKSGVAAKHGKLAVGDNIVAVGGLDMAGEVAKHGESAIAAVLKMFKGSSKNSLPIRVKRMVWFDASIQDRLQHMADEANRKSTSTSAQSPKSAQQQRRKRRMPRFGEDYRVKIKKGPRGIGLSFTTKDTGNSNLGKKALVSSVVPGMPAAQLGIIKTGDSVVSLQGYSMRRRTSPISIILQLVSRVSTGSTVDIVFHRESRANGKRSQNARQRRFRKRAESSEERAQTLRPDSVSCEIISPTSLAHNYFKHSNGNVACMAADFGPPILDEPGIIGEIVKSEPVHGCTPLVGTNSGRFKGNIVVMRRGTCYFNLKVVNAQRAGAIAVVVSQEPENSQLFPMGIDADATSFQPEPVSIPAVMISHKDAQIILSATLSNKVRFGLFGNYNYRNGANNVDLAVPEEDPFELKLHFEQGSFDLRMGKPGIVGNPRAKGRRRILRHTMPFSALYRQNRIVLSLKRTELCPVCHGKGGVEGGLKPCPICGNTESPGRHVVHDRLGHTCSQQTERTCHVCHGHGEVLKHPKHTCPHCHGRRIISRDRLLNVTLLPGFPNGYSVLFRDFGDETPHSEPGDVEVIVKHEHARGFVRHGADIHTTIHLNVLEALMGFERSIQLPDNRTVNIQRQDKLCAPGTVFTFHGFGLPIFKKKGTGHKSKIRVVNSITYEKENEESAKNEQESKTFKTSMKENYGALVVVVALRPQALESMTDRQRKALRDALRSAPGKMYQEWSSSSSRRINYGTGNFGLERNGRKDIDTSTSFTVKEANATSLIEGINRFWFSPTSSNSRLNR